MSNRRMKGCLVFLAILFLTISVVSAIDLSSDSTDSMGTTDTAFRLITIL